MRRKGAERPEAGKALKDLRELLGQSQADFAQSIDMSPVVVARWETSQPPRGKHLRTLINLAYSHSLPLKKEIDAKGLDVDPKVLQRCRAFDRISAKFGELYTQELVASAVWHHMVIAREGERPHCYMTTRVEGEEAVDAAEALFDLIEATKNKSASRRRAQALRLLASFAQQAQEITGRLRRGSKGLYCDGSRVND